VPAETGRIYKNELEVRSEERERKPESAEEEKRRGREKESQKAREGEAK